MILSITISLFVDDGVIELPKSIGVGGFDIILLAVVVVVLVLSDAINLPD